MSNLVLSNIILAPNSIISTNGLWQYWYEIYLHSGRIVDN